MTIRLAASSMVLAICCAQRPASDHSHAADEMIKNAKTPAEREELTRVRDEVDAAARERIKELDAEIERLQEQNAQLRN